ncbi:MAG: hypothetical protein R3F56_25560 [Planctomycetota bacterium]
MLPQLILPLLLHLSLPHPHVPKAIVMHGAGGQATLTWFTVPFNPEQVKTLPNGQGWHLGFAMLQVGMPLACGDVKVPVGNYKLDVQRDEKGEFSTFRLVPAELLRVTRTRRGQQPDQQKIAEVKKDLAARGIPEAIDLPATTFSEGDAEHLEFAAMTRGYEAAQRGSAEPKGGASFSVFANFGDMHRRVDLVESFPKNETDGQGNEKKVEAKKDR